METHLSIAYIMHLHSIIIMINEKWINLIIEGFLYVT